MLRMTGDQPMRRPECVGPVEIKDREPLRKDLENFKAALEGAGVTDAFMTSSSPGVASVFMPNAYYSTPEAYIEALGAAMKEEYEAIAGAGFVLQVDCPDLAMAFHTAFQDLNEDEFLRRIEHHVEVLNAALENVPAESVRMHVCWGNYEGPHDHDIPVSKIMSVVLRAKPSRHPVRGVEPAPRPRVDGLARRQDPRRQSAGPRRSRFHQQLRGAPGAGFAQRIETFAAIVGRERVLAGSDCGFGTFAGYGKMDSDHHLPEAGVADGRGGHSESASLEVGGLGGVLFFPPTRPVCCGGQPHALGREALSLCTPRLGAHKERPTLRRSGAARFPLSRK